MAPNLVDCVIHWKKKLDKNPDEDVILNVIHKLSKIPITVEILEATHIGKSIRNLAKRNDIVGEKAKVVLNKWRNVFVNLHSKDSKPKSINNEDNVEKHSSKRNLTQEQSVYHKKDSSDDELKEKYKKSNSSHSSMKQSSEKHINGNKSSQLLVPAMNMYPLNDSNVPVETNMTCYSGNSETFLSGDKRKSPSSNDSHAISSLKRKLKTDEKEAHMDSFSKKVKSENYSGCQSKEKKKHKNPVDKEQSLSHHSRKEHGSSSHLQKAKNENSKDKNATEPEKSKVKIQSSDGFTASSASFEDCLGFNDIVTVKKKKSSKPQSSIKKLPSVSSSDRNKASDKKVTNNSNKKKNDGVQKKSSHSEEKQSDSIPNKSKIFDVPKDNSPSFSAMQPYFTPSQNQSLCTLKQESFNEDVIKFTSSRKEKTAIYSGRKSYNKEFPTLAQCCYRYLIENIDILGELGDLPYKLLKPILDKCTPNQLFTIERYNPQLLDETNELWKEHCRRDYKLLSPLEHETWRDVYLRGFDEHEENLKKVSANISAKMLKATPVRQVKLAFIDDDVKPPREVLRRQAKARLLVSGAAIVKPQELPKVNVKKSASLHCSSTSSQNFVVDKKDMVKSKQVPQSELLNRPPSPKINAKSVTPIVEPPATNKDIAALSLAAKKPKVAPLMAKSLKTMKQCFRR